MPPVVHAQVIDKAPNIDGVIDDECWNKCTRMTGFKVRSDDREPALQTEVMICTDEDNLYIAFICHDPQPSLIRALQQQRNSSLGSDDYVGAVIDTLHDHQTHYHFEVNARGVQNESIPAGGTSNITWRGDWRAAAKIGDNSWCVEMAIPYHSLRYPAKADTFGITFRRYVPRLDEETQWPDIGPNPDQTRWADLMGLDLPLQRSRPVFMPYSVSSTEPGRRFSDVGFDYKEELPDNVIRMMTYNPDFTDVQDAVSSIAYSYTEQYLPEKRPFFQEGSAMFPDSTAFYSRRIGDINWGAKTFGRHGNRSFAFMDATKVGESNHFASTYLYDLSPDAGGSIYFTGSSVRPAYKLDPSEPDNNLCISPGAYRSWRDRTGITTLSLRNYFSMNSDSQGRGSYLRAGLEKSAASGHLGYGLQWEDISSDYYVRDAYVPLTGVRGISTSLDYSDRPQSGRYTWWDIYGDIKRYWAPDNTLHHDTYDIGVGAYTKSEWALGGLFATGSWLGQADSSKQLYIQWLTRHLYGGGTLSLLTGKREGLDYKEMSLRQSLKVSKRIVFDLGYEWTRLAGSSAQKKFTVLGNYEITPEKTFGVWMVGTGSDTNLCCTYKQTVRSGSDIYLIYGYPNTYTTQSRLALKIVRPMEW